MKKYTLSVVLILFFLSALAHANTPTEALQLSVDQLIAIAAKKDVSDENKKMQLAEIINADVNFNQVSRRIILKKWKSATAEQKAQFKKQFSKILVDTYADLLKNYSNQKVVYLKEQLKRKKYAIVDTEVVTDSKKIPVRYRLVKSKQSWKIYDFVVEGVSIVSTYKNTYKSILRKGGIELLLKEMVKAKDKHKKE